MAPLTHPAPLAGLSRPWLPSEAHQEHGTPNTRTHAPITLPTSLFRLRYSGSKPHYPLIGEQLLDVHRLPGRAC